MRNARRFCRFVFVCAVQLTVSACGSTTPDNPIGPTPPGPNPGTGSQMVTVISGDTQAPVANAEVIIGSQRVTTGADGTAVFQNVASNAQVSIEAAGFISPRQTLLNGSPLTLIPDGLHFVEIVYGDWPHLVRWQQSTEVPFYLPEDLREAAIVQAHLDAIQIINNAQSHIRFRYTEQESEARVRGILDPSLASTAVADIQHGGGGITGCTIRYVNKTAATNRRIPAHEMGHCYGLIGHNPIQGMMVVGRLSDDFTAQEKTVMRLQLMRNTGNMRPDRDGGAHSSVASLGSAKRLAIVD